MTSIKHLDNHNGMRCCDAFSAISKTVDTAVMHLSQMDTAALASRLLPPGSYLPLRRTLLARRDQVWPHRLIALCLQASQKYGGSRVSRLSILVRGRFVTFLLALRRQMFGNNKSY